MEIKITVEAPELAAAINNLAAALKENGLPTVKTAPVPTAAQKATPAQTSPVPTTDTPPAVPTATPAQTAAVPTATPTQTAAVPTAPPPQYTHEQIMKAGAAMIDNGKIVELQNLIKSFGVVKVMDLKQEQLGAFATELRKLGAKI